jgi:hypothetical protein
LAKLAAVAGLPPPLVTPDAGEFVDDPDELSLLRFWRDASFEKRVKVLLDISKARD